MSKIIYIDTETTGLIKYVNALIQVAYIIEIDGKVRKRGSFRINPLTYTKNVKISNKALEVNNIDRADFKKFLSADIALSNFIETLKKYIDITDKNDKFIVVGYNVDFDVGFIQEWFRDQNKGSVYPLLFRMNMNLDVFNLYKYLNYLGLIKHKYKSYTLEKACLSIGMEFDAHDAVADIEATRDLHLHIKDILDVSKTK